MSIIEIKTTFTESNEYRTPLSKYKQWVSYTGYTTGKTLTDQYGNIKREVTINDTERYGFLWLKKKNVKKTFFVLDENLKIWKQTDKNINIMKPINQNKSSDCIVEKINPNIFIRNWYNHGIDLKELGLKEDQIVIIALAGSRMYGTDTPTSDMDYLGVYIPKAEDILLNKVKHHIPLKKLNIDLQIWSIYKFLDLLCKGDTISLDLLHSSCNNWLVYNKHIWSTFVKYKNLFYTKNMKSFVGYARTQAAKYGIKGTRIKTVEKVVNFLEIENKWYDIPIKQIWYKLPTGDHIHFLNDTKPYRLYQVCGRKFQETVKISYILDSLKKLLTEYGKRANIAKDNKGIDWKAFSHAIRSAEQVYWILKYGEYKYPLKNCHFMKQVKLGKIPFEMAQAVLEDYMIEIERLMLKSKLPKIVNKKVWDRWLINLLQNYLI